MFGFTPFATAPFAALGSVSVAVQLTGVQAEALRDLPQTQTDPFNIIWPAIPA